MLQSSKIIKLIIGCFFDLILHFNGPFFISKVVTQLCLMCFFFPDALKKNLVARSSNEQKMAIEPFKWFIRAGDCGGNRLKQAKNNCNHRVSSAL